MSTPLIRVILLVNYVNGSNVEGIDNLNAFKDSLNLNLHKEEKDENVSFVLYSLLDLLIDKSCSEDLLSYSGIFEGCKWLHISYETLLKTFKLYMVSKLVKTKSWKRKVYISPLFARIKGVQCL